MKAGSTSPTFAQTATLNSAELADRVGGLKKAGRSFVGLEWPVILRSELVVAECSLQGWLRPYAIDTASEGAAITQSGREALQRGKEEHDRMTQNGGSETAATVPDPDRPNQWSSPNEILDQTPDRTDSLSPQ